MHQIPQTLTPVVQNYAWGKPAKDSIVGKLGGISSGDQPCAELWMGAHKSAPSTLRVGGETKTLSDFIASNPEEVLGKRVAEKFGQLPLLFKVLSVGSPLSIQAHPDIPLAKKLFADPSRAGKYPDDNHKPEAAIAITPLSLLYGFKEEAQLSTMLAQGSEAMRNFYSGVANDPKSLYHHLMTADSATLTAATEAHLKEISGKTDLSPEDKWFKRSHEIYGSSDVGLFALYLMNVVTVPVGKAVFIDSKIPHAYLDGDLIECMAASDNVVRAGLTPKYQDRETLLAMLHYNVHLPEILELQPRTANSAITCLKVPAAEFTVSRVGPGNEETVAIDGIQIVLQLKGSGTIEVARKQHQLTEGSVMMIPAGAKEFKVRANTGGEMFIASVPQ